MKLYYWRVLNILVQSMMIHYFNCVASYRFKQPPPAKHAIIDTLMVVGVDNAPKHWCLYIVYE